MSVRRVRHVLTIVALSLFAVVGVPNAMSAGVTPKTVFLKLNPGQSVTIDKSVETTKLPPDSDFVFLADNTGSMEPTMVPQRQMLATATPMTTARRQMGTAGRGMVQLAGNW